MPAENWGNFRLSFVPNNLKQKPPVISFREGFAYFGFIEN
jgi:hypothetical protein